MLSRKHYQAIAEIIRSRRSTGDNDRLVVAEDLASYFKSDNPNFDRERFLRACGLSERVES